MYKKEIVARDETKVVLREPKITDAKSSMKFINSVISEKNSGITLNKKNTLAKEKSWLKNILKDLKAKERVSLFMIHDGKIKGSCSIKRRPWKKRHRGVLGVSISKDMRGKGLGKLLIKEIISLAKKKLSGLKSVELYVFDYNKRAQHVYEKIGFKKMGYIKNSAREGNKYIDSIMMCYQIK